MSQLIVDKVAEAIAKQCSKVWDGNAPYAKVMFRECVKAAITALRDLPDNTFETGIQKLEYERVIDTITIHIAIGK